MPGAGSAIRIDHARRRHERSKGRRPVRFREGEMPAQVYDRYALLAGACISGPAIFEENESTFMIGPGGRAEVLSDGSILVELPK